MRVSRREFVAAALVAGAASPRATEASPRTRTPRATNADKTSGAAPARVLVFDTFGTVVDWRSSVIAEGERLGRAKRLTVDWAAFADAWRAGYGPSMEKVRKGELPWTKLDALHRTTLDGLIERFAITGLSEEETAHLNRVWHRLSPWPDSVAGLKRLKKRYVIAPLSNGNLSLLTNMAKQANLPWDCILSVELVHHYKPDKETYLMVADFFDVAPADVMMVAAHPGDLRSAKALGLKTAYVHRPLEYGPARTPTAPEAGQFDFMAKDFRDLADQLGV